MKYLDIKMQEPGTRALRIIENSPCMSGRQLVGC